MAGIAWPLSQGNPLYFSWKSATCRVFLNHIPLHMRLRTESVKPGYVRLKEIYGIIKCDKGTS